MANRDNHRAAQSRAGGGAASPAEIARFDALAAQWWDPAGPMAPLHAMNPLRIGWITVRLPTPGTLLDVGCGAGLAAEALAKAGHTVLGIDAAPAPIEAAKAHAHASNFLLPLPLGEGGAAQGSARDSVWNGSGGRGEGPPITSPTKPQLDYRVATTPTLVAERRRFAAITALEVIEHVPDPAGFLRDLAALLEPGGHLFVSTLNRTARSLLVAKFGAEYILRLLPIGTHDWRRFITPPELARLARTAGLRMTDSAGMSFDPLTQRWRISRDLGVNYIAAFQR